VSMKNGTWRKIWIREIEGILMILKGNIPKNRAKVELPTIEPLTSRFILSDLDLDFFARKLQIKVYKHYKTVHCVYAYHYILLVQECRHPKILLRWKCRIPWRSMEETEIRISSISKDIHSKHHP
jgi:hypothetical protein